MTKSWAYGFYIIVAVLVFLNYSLLKLRGIALSQRQKEITYPPLLDKRRGLKEGIQSCCNALLCPIEGEWHMKNRTSIKQFSYVEHTNMQLRMRKGWPAQLYHGDLRCGTMYPLPRLVRKQNTQIFMSDIISQCNSYSQAPCCRNDIGWCGEGEFFCRCETCLNYRNIIQTELYDWKHKLKCIKPKLVKKETCDFLANQFTSVTFIGDSLVRHVFSSLLIQLTEDPQTGALKPNLHQTEKQYCSDENQFVDSACHSKLSIDWHEVNAHPEYCNTSISKPKVFFIQAYASHLGGMAYEKVNKILSEQRPLILIGIGIHDNFNHDKVIDEYLAPLIQLRNERIGYSNPVIVWLNTHAAGLLKPIGYQKTQGNERILKFNSVLYDYCRRNSIFVFDTFNMTKGVHSFDGTHYGKTLNQLKVEILLNSLRMLKDW
ncbi:uncharacterized protein [Clytia hemisphaerica]|uniref:uncharacterized protein n=1 Tax=Clytia hemisphaerica TaxID=252671 RepID=UPI0034D62EA6